MIFCGTLSSQRFCIDFQNNLWCTQVLKLKLLSSIDSKINFQYYFWQLSRLAEFNIILIRCHFSTNPICSHSSRQDTQNLDSHVFGLWHARN